MCGNMDEDQSNMTTWQVMVRPKEGDGSSFEWAEIVEQLPEGEHLVQVEFRSGDCAELDFRQNNTHSVSEPMAIGEFTLVKKGGEVLKGGRTFENSYKSGTVDENMEAQMLKNVQDHAQRKGWDEKFEKLKIKSSDWYIIRNEYTGIVLRRTIDVYAYAVWPDGHCTVQKFTLSQEHDGSDFSNVYFVYDVGQQDLVDCS